MRKRFAMLACVVTLFAHVWAAYAQEVILRNRWAKGDQVRYRITQQSNVTMSGLPVVGEMSQEQKIVQVVRMAVEDVAADGSVTLRETFESVRVEQNSPMGKTVFDSTSAEKPDDPDAARLGTFMSAMIGESITVVLGPSGAVSRVEGMSRIWDKAFDSLPQDPVMALFFNQVKASLNDDAMRNTVDQGFSGFPDRTLNAGDTWSDQFQIDNPLIGKMTTTRTYTLKGVDRVGGGSIARIALTLAIKQEGDGAPAGPFATIAKFARLTSKVGDAKSEGEILFDISKGRTQKTSMMTEVPIAISMNNPNTGQINAQGVGRTTMLMELVE